MNPHVKAVAVALAVGASILIFAVVAVAQPAHAQGSTIHVKGGEFFFKPNRPTARRGRITIVFKNVGHVNHDLKVSGKRTAFIRPGKSARLVLKLTKRGNYPFICTVPGHAQAGMRGMLRVR